MDDDERSLRALRAVLEPLGQRMLSASSGEEALRRLLREEFAVILLDVRMPGLDGLQTASYINARARTRHVPIIFLTAHAEDVEQVFRAYAAGAVDYVVKPFDPDVLRSKVAVFVELQRERGERVREARARAEAEVIAGTLQRHLLPDRLPEVPALAMAARYRPSERVAQVGGDWYDAIELPGGGIGLVIGDVVGHGVHAATLMGELRAALRAYAVSRPRSPAAVVTSLNAMVASTHSARMVATLLYMVVDEDGTHVRFASAGHLPPLLMSADGDTRFLEYRHDPPLGAKERADFGEWEGELDREHRAAVHRRPGGAAWRDDRRRAHAPARGAGRRSARASSGCARTCSTARSAAATHRTTSRCWRCGWREPVRAHSSSTCPPSRRRCRLLGTAWSAGWSGRAADATTSLRSSWR